MRMCAACSSRHNQKLPKTKTAMPHSPDHAKHPPQVRAALLPLLAWRIRAEERLLGQDAAYLAYARVTRWRLLPGLW